jgi:hypothetical protein
MLRRVSVKWCGLVLLFTVSVILGLSACKEEKMDSKVKFWELIDALEKSRPFRKENVEALVGTDLKIESENMSHIYYLSEQENGKSAVGIVNVDLRVRKNDPAHQGFLLIELSGAPVTPEDVLKRYPDAWIQGPTAGPPPQGFPDDAETAIWVQRDWGQISFGFALKEPENLNSVGFHTGKKR